MLTVAEDLMPDPELFAVAPNTVLPTLLATADVATATASCCAADAAAVAAAVADCAMASVSRSRS